MCVRYGRHDHNIQLFILHQVFGGPVALDARVVLLSVVVRLGMSLYDRIKLEVCNDLEEWNVEDFGRHAITNDAHIVGFGRHNRVSMIWLNWPIEELVTQHRYSQT